MRPRTLRRREARRDAERRPPVTVQDSRAQPGSFVAACGCVGVRLITVSDEATAEQVRAAMTAPASGYARESWS